MRQLPPSGFLDRSLPITFMAAAALALSLVTTPVDATVVTTNFSGTITLFSPENSFGLTERDPVFGTVIFDDELVSPSGTTFLSVDSDPDFDLTLSIGDVTFEAADDFDFGFGFPALNFLNGALVGIDFVAGTSDPDGASLEAFGNEFSLFEPDAFLTGSDPIQGVLDFTVLTTAALGQFGEQVPEPTAMIIIGFGLAILVAAPRRRRSKESA